MAQILGAQLHCEPRTLEIVELIIISVRRRKSCKIKMFMGWEIFCSTFSF